MFSRYTAYRRMGMSLMVNPVGLMAPPVAIALMATSSIMDIEAVSQLFFAGQIVFALATFTLALVVLVDFFMAPAWGMYYAYRIGKDYGPKVQGKAVEYFCSNSYEQFDLAAIAEKVGEVESGSQ
jgi:hypothetical protein